MNHMFYFLLALTAVLAATVNAGPVLDSNGEPIFGGSYYVIPTLRGPSGGGLNLAIRHGNQCPLFIGQEGSNANRGFPVKFSNWRSRVGFVPESENLNIQMDVQNALCGLQSTYWWVTAAPSPWRSLFITAGPKPEAGGENSARSFFQIKKVGVDLNSYQIAFCRDHEDCVDVGVKVDASGVRRLIVGSVPIGFQPFVVSFVKANQTETLPETMSII